jgi:hypothetical protein
MADIQFGTGDAVLSAADCFLGFDELRRKFDPFAVIDFCSGIEAAVLHERVYTFGLPPVTDNPVLEALISEGVLTDLIGSDLYRVDPATMISHPAARVPLFLLQLLKEGQIEFSYPKKLHSQEDFREVTTWFFAALFAAAKDLVVSDRLPIPLVPTASMSIILRNHPTLRSENEGYRRMEADLAETYSEIKELLIQERTKFDGHAQLSIPPIALDVLNRTERSEDLGNAVLDARERFAKLRHYFSELNECFQSTKVPLRKKVVEAAKLRRAIAVATEQGSLGKDGLTTAVSFLRGSNDVAQVEKLSKGIDVGNLGLSKLIGILVGFAEHAYWKFKLKPLHALKRSYMEMNSFDIKRAIKAHFFYEISERDRGKIAGYEQLAMSMSKLFEQFGPPENAQQEDSS